MTGSLVELLLAAVAFAGSHVLLSSAPVRGPLARALGEWPFVGLYSAISLGLFVWLVGAYGDAPLVELWAAPTVVRYVALGVMVVASVLVACGLSLTSPTGVSLKPAAAGAPLPGIFKVTRHPVLWGIGLWAVVHVMANGDLASLILFGSLGVLALGGTVHIDRKKRTTMGGDWRAFAGATSNVPFAAIAAGRTRVSLKEIGYGRLVAGLVLYMVLLLGHEAVIGVAPLAP
ncbi:MAG: NnrU family protein [Proteobacteria bacterium]|nr:NnrU family protein [Pseudomonadota bacterium]